MKRSITAAIKLGSKFLAERELESILLDNLYPHFWKDLHQSLSLSLKYWPWHKVISVHWQSSTKYTKWADQQDIKIDWDQSTYATEEQQATGGCKMTKKLLQVSREAKWKGVLSHNERVLQS